MKNSVLIVVFILITSVLYGQSVHHTLSMPDPKTHYFHIETELSGFKGKELVVAMPVWSPGSYLVREYPKNVNQVRAFDENGRVLPIKKIKKNQWKIEKGKAKTVRVKYESYAFDLTVRTAFLDETHGFLSGVNVFMYPKGYKNLGGKLTIIPHESFVTITAPLKVAADGFASDVRSTTFLFEDFDELADSPIEIGNQEVFTFEAAGVKHQVAMYGTGSYNIERLQKDMAKIVESATAIFGQNPNEDYTFIVHNVVKGSGGLEHMNSTTLSVNRWVYDEATYLNFLSLVAHEYFHVWMVKRIRPEILVDYDYNQENYTDLLWVMEGFTSYYDKLLLRRAGFYSEAQYLNRMQGLVNWVEGSEGSKVQSIADASMDAWIKAYMPNENSPNTTISYYSKGGLVATIFDAMIIKHSNGEKSLDDFLQALYEDYYEKKNVGITEAKMISTLKKFVSKDIDLDDFFARYVNGTDPLPYEQYFKEIGVEVSAVTTEKTDLGLTLETKDDKLVISNVKSGSSAEKAGLSPNDEVIAFNGIRVDKVDFDSYISEVEAGDEFNLIISRDLLLRSVDVEMISNPSTRYTFKLTDDKLTKFWLREE